MYRIMLAIYILKWTIYVLAWPIWPPPHPQNNLIGSNMQHICGKLFDNTGQTIFYDFFRKLRPEIKVTVTHKQYATLRDHEMCPQTKFGTKGIPKLVYGHTLWSLPSGLHVYCGIILTMGSKYLDPYIILDNIPKSFLVSIHVSLKQCNTKKTAYNKFNDSSTSVKSIPSLHYMILQSKPTSTVLSAKSDSDVVFCLQSYQGLRIDRPLVY